MSINGMVLFHAHNIEKCFPIYKKEIFSFGREHILKLPMPILYCSSSIRGCPFSFIKTGIEICF